MTRRGFVAGSMGTIVTAAALALPATTVGKIYPGTRVAGIDVSGMTPEAATEHLRAELAAVEAHAATFTFDGQRWEASLADLGISIDYDLMVEQAMAHGRNGSVIDRYTSLLGGDDDDEVEMRLVRDDSTLRSWLETIENDIAVEPHSARLQNDDGEISIIEHVTGRTLDWDQLISDTNRSVVGIDVVSIPVAVVPVEPKVTTAKLSAAREHATRLISEPIYFTYDGDVYPVDVPTLTAALEIDENNTASLDLSLLTTRLDAIAAAVFTPAQNIKLGWNDGLFVVEDDVDGLEVDRDAFEADVARVVASAERSAPLPVVPVRAGARADNLDELGLEGHLAYGGSSFAGSSETRAENVAVSARNISYKLVAPGELFSFNDLLGPITEEAGFVQGKIIQGDWAASDLGGGVCQVSTTVFRAAAHAGFQFEEWHPHSWRLAFYEADGSPPGMDGAIYQPNTPDEIEKDLIFQNPLDSWLLLMMVIDGHTVYAHLYGRDNGWEVEFGEPRISEPKPIPDPVERVNPKLASGDRIKVQNARAGVTVRIQRTVTAKDGSVISDGDFVSDYRSVPEAWEVGPS